MRHIKNILAGTFALATVALVAGCIKEDYIGTCEQPEAGDITIVASLDKMKLTKATVEDNATERTITHIDIFVVDSEGNIDWYERNADGNDKTQGQGKGYLKLSQKRTTKVNGNYLFEQGEEYKIYLLANSAQTEATMKSLLTKDALEALVEQTEKVYCTGMEEEAPQTFLMDAVAKLGNNASIEINPVTTPTEHLELKATFNRAASKVIVNIKQGTEVRFVPEGINSVLPQAEFSNLASKTSVLPLGSPLADAGLVNSEAKNVDNKVLAWDADTKTYTVTAYTYSHLWEEGADNESALIVNIPMLWDEDGKDEAGKLEIDDQAPESWYKIPLSQDNEFGRNYCYIVNLTINAVGAPSELDIIELQDVEFVSLPWQEVEMKIGQNEPKYLVLNTDLVEIYDVNEDLEQLKFTSSSPIKSITLKDCYNHDDRGNIEANAEMAEKDGLFVYYIDKFGQKIQLGQDPGFDLKDIDHPAWTKADILAKEMNLYNKAEAAKQHIRAEVPQGQERALNGDIHIFSPINAVAGNEDLEWNSHFNTVRYLEFEVENIQGLTTTFRVVQTPLTVISNKEGYFSYRDDFRIGNDPVQHTPIDFPGDPFGQIKPVDKGPLHFLNPGAPYFAISGFLPYHDHEVAADGDILYGCTTHVDYEEMVYGFMYRDYYRSWGPGLGTFHRAHYYYEEDANGKRAHFNTHDISATDKYYQALTAVYEKQVDGKTKYYRRHFSGNFFVIFYSKYVHYVYKEDNIAKNRKKGQADIYTVLPDVSNPNFWNGWVARTRQKPNHRMYHVRVTATSNEYIIANPLLCDDDGNLTNDRSRGLTAEGDVNARMISPSFMVASQLGESFLPQGTMEYKQPDMPFFYKHAKKHCQEYVEARYEDVDGDGKYSPGDKVYHYDDWRLPTAAEIDYLVNHQQISRAMDVVLSEQYYFHASKTPGVYTKETILSSQIDGYSTAGWYMRCVRDAYVEPEPVIYDANYNIVNGKK